MNRQTIAQAVQRFWDQIPETIKTNKRQAIRQQVEIMAAQPWASPGALHGRSQKTINNNYAVLADLSTLWDIAAGYNQPDRIERLIWAETLKQNSPTNDEVQAINRQMHSARIDIFAAFIFETCQDLPDDLRDFTWDWLIWAECPIIDTSHLVKRMNRSIQPFYGPPKPFNPWERIEAQAPAPRYKLSAPLADATWDRLQAGLINPTKPKERNDAGADLIRAAGYFWQLIERMTAAELFRAFENPELAPDERTAELLKKAALVFSKPPDTNRTIRNYLKA